MTVAGTLETAAVSELGVGAMLDPDHPVKRKVAEWASAELGHGDLVTADRESRFARDDWQACADRGILGLLVPTEYGGSGGDLITALLTLEGLGDGCSDNGLTFAVASQVLSTQFAIERFGSHDQKRRWLPRMCDGAAIGAFAITEHDSGSDVFSMSTVAVPTDAGGYRLDGGKAHLTLGSTADVIVTFAATTPEAGRWGVSAFIVPSDANGVVLEGNREKMGMRTTPFGDITFDGVEVGADALLGPVGAGGSIFDATLEVERAFVLAPQIGAMGRLLREAIEYAQERRQGGRPIGDHQAVAHRIADMKVRFDVSRLVMYRAALQMVRGESAVMSAAISKLLASEAALDSALDATRTFGARGYRSEHGVERNVRDAIGGLIYSGTSDIQRNIIAGLLGVGR